ncbi:uncharacterized protein BYT42DRAFT_646166 [Radiomyces spectabilis]|uniref:uncharacterized protein n=1 Tax=Radiomyces spectabilis TaxID=64574 RepID=UPI00221EF9B1|nr:uncharacterized protein BYT42DRAFT_646166 [Radiomyces spectabilis]KAI8374124.1 hypothetical protein BYT42DRAFT_646166 [Radiomyces spectabilis]
MSRFQNKRAPKKSKPSNEKHKEPKTFEEFMEEGVEYEDKGERYATGDRAQRNYERALEMYSKAHVLNPNDSDCLYNWGRVLFLLLNFLPAHTLPEEKLERVDRSIEKFRQALSLEPNKTDVQFNLGQALHLRSEILQETTEIDGAYRDSAMALQEAIDLFDTVYKLQEEEYKGSQSATEKEGENEEQDVTMQDSQEEKEEVKESQGDVTTVTQVEATTVQSLIETLLSGAEAMSTMASLLASVAASMDLFNKARRNLSMAEKWLSEIPETDKDHKQLRIQINLKEAQTFAAMADRSFLASNQVDRSLYDQAIQRLDDIVERMEPRHVEACCDRGDVLTSYAQALVDQSEKTKTPLVPETSGKEVWQLYSQANKSFQVALQIESKNLSILNKLGDLSIARARLPLPVAERNKLQLLKNAEFYFKQAVDTDKQVLTSGWIGWAFSAWTVEAWGNVQGKKSEAGKIIQTWIKRGGRGSLFQDMVDDNDTLDPEFVRWASDSFFDGEDSDSD